MKRKILLITLLWSIGLVTSVSAQFTTAAAYGFRASSGTYSYLTGGTTVPSGLGFSSATTVFSEDEVLSTVPIGFTFNFAGTNYTNLYACSNGYIAFVSPVNIANEWYYDNSSRLSAVVPALLPMWDDLNGWSTTTSITNPGVATYSTTGTAPNRIFTIEYKNWGWYDAGAISGGLMSFQILLYENGNGIEYRYKPEGSTSIPTSSGGYTIGIAKTATDFQTLPTSGTNPTPSTSTYNSGLTTKPASGQSYFFGCLVLVTADPASVAVCAGNNTSFSCATSNGTTFQWQTDGGTGTFTNITNGGVYSNATTSTLNITGVTAGMNGYKYRCLVGNGSCTIGTGVATLTTGSTATAISTQPAAKTSVCAAANTTISLTATGVGNTYQWQEDPNTGTFANITNGGVYSNATTNTLTITGATTALTNYKYRCIVGGACTPLTVTSNPDTLTVNPNATITTAPPATLTICQGTTTTISVTATGATTYQWQQDPNTGTFANASNTAPLSGVSTSTLTITNAPTSINNYKYRVIVNNAGNCPNTSTATALTVNSLPAVTTNPPVKTTICTGSNTTMTAAGSGTGVSYKWQVNPASGTYTDLTNTPPYSNVNTATMSITNAPNTLSGYTYRCVISGTCTPSVNTTPDTLFVYDPPVITLQPLDKAVCNGNNAVFVVKATGGQLSYQWQERTPTSAFSNLSNSSLYKGTTTDTLTVNAATLSKYGYQYQCVVTGFCGAPATTAPVTLFVNDYTAVTYITPSVATCDSVNTQMYVQAAGSGLTYQWQLNPGTSFSNISNSGTYSGVNSDTLRITNPTGILSGNLYRVVVNGVCGNPVNSDPVPLTVNAFPKLQSQPQDDSVGVGQQASFSVTAIGTAVTYQWQVDELDASGYQNLFDNLAYSGTHTNTLTINGTYLTKNGYLYRCIAQGLCGVDDTSAPAKLGVGVDTASTVAGLSYHAGVTIYPNPVKGNEMIIKMDHVSDKDIYLKIVDQLGRVVFAENIHLAHDNTATVNVSKLLPGIYTIQLSDQFYNQVRSLRFSKE